MNVLKLFKTHNVSVEKQHMCTPLLCHSFVSMDQDSGNDERHLKRDTETSFQSMIGNFWQLTRSQKNLFYLKKSIISKTTSVEKNYEKGAVYKIIGTDLPFSILRTPTPSPSPHRER